ncbi:MAG: PhzF family phenazine biosynthesis protein [Actinomycetales bacterium]|nr:PhzF family phenazine biosynthesis protein [Candidatus Phosphoribacter baldrii]
MNARTSLAFRLLNVFAIDGDPFSGNPLAVVEDASGLDEARMQAIARQFNLSESTFVTRCPGTGTADADVRIFTPGFEMPFAGHPTLGTAYVIGERLGRQEVTLRVPAGDIPVRRSADDPARWVLTANRASVTAGSVERADLATIVGSQRPTSSMRVVGRFRRGSVPHRADVSRCGAGCCGRPRRGGPLRSFTAGREHGAGLGVDRPGQHRGAVLLRSGRRNARKTRRRGRPRQTSGVCWRRGVSAGL